MQRHSAIALSVILFGIASYLISQGMPNGVAPTSLLTAGYTLFGAALYVVTFYLMSVGLITLKNASLQSFGSAPAISGILLAIAQVLAQYATGQPVGSTSGALAAFVAAGITALTYWLMQQGLITARGASASLR